MVYGKSFIGIGAQYGDEGKIKIFDQVIQDAKVWARFNGGPNAGHNLKVGDIHIVTHGVPSGFTRESVLGYIGSGTVVNPEKLNVEIADIVAHGFNLENRLFISGNASLIQPHHTLLDGLKGKEIGTTGNGIGPAYADQAQRQLGRRLKNIRMGDYLANPTECFVHVRANLEEVVQKHKLSKVNTHILTKRFDEETKRLEKYLCEDPFFLENIIEQGENVFFEGANAIMLDVVQGIVPYVTSSRTIAAAAYTGGDLSLRYHHKTIAVAKAIMSRVGNGPFVSEFGSERSEDYCKAGGGYKNTKEAESELYDSCELLKSDDPLHIGIALRMLGGEYGATTKRPRRIGMLDLVMLRQNCRLNAVDELYLNKVDCLRQFADSSLPGIPLVMGYELDGQCIEYMPSTEGKLRRVMPVVEYLPPFTQDISKARRREELPGEVLEFIRVVEEYVGTPIFGIGVGAEREEYVALK